MWLRRYNGDLVKTCDYLTRVSQVELPQHEDDDVVELDGEEDIEMIDLTQSVGDDESESESDDDDVIVEEDGHEGINFVFTSFYSYCILKDFHAHNFW